MRPTISSTTGGSSPYRLSTRLKVSNGRKYSSGLSEMSQSSNLPPVNEFCLSGEFERLFALGSTATRNGKDSGFDVSSEAAFPATMGDLSSAVSIVNVLASRPAVAGVDQIAPLSDTKKDISSSRRPDFGHGSRNLLRNIGCLTLQMFLFKQTEIPYIALSPNGEVKAKVGLGIILDIEKHSMVIRPSGDDLNSIFCSPC